MSTYLACLSTPTEIVQVAPLVHALRARGHAVHVLHNGPPAEAIDGLYGFFDMPPDTRISPLQKAPRLSHQTAELISRLDTHLQQIAPDVVLVHGNSHCALAGALAASYQDVPVAHIAAGWRSEGRASFPEDMNSSLIDRMARWHFPATPAARQNLLGDGLAPEQIHALGSTVVDAAQWARQRMARSCLKHLVPPDVMRFLRQHEHGQLLLVSAQQREHWGRPLQRMAAAVAGLLQLHPELTVVWPLPASPLLRANVHMGLACLPTEVHPRLCLTDTLPYPALITLLEACQFAMTDSGRLQPEASALQKPVLILRDSTERHTLAEAGGALMAGHMAHQIVELASECLRDPLLLESMRLSHSPFGDGMAAQRMANILSAQTEPRLPSQGLTA